MKSYERFEELDIGPRLAFMTHLYGEDFLTEVQIYDGYLITGILINTLDRILSHWEDK